jgi:hypothetical protein
VRYRRKRAPHFDALTGPDVSPAAFHPLGMTKCLNDAASRRSSARRSGWAMDRRGGNAMIGLPPGDGAARE